MFDLNMRDNIMLILNRIIIFEKDLMYIKVYKL